MLDYKEVKKELAALLKEPEPTDFESSFTSIGEAIVKTVTQERPTHIPIGSWSRLNAALGGGLREREFTILCGPTGAGKSTLLANLAAQLISNLTPIFIASVEIGVEDFTRKIISVVTQSDLKYGEDLNEILKKVGKPFLSKNTVFTNYDSRVPHLQLLCDLLYAHRTKGVKVALVDNLNFIMEVTRAQDQVISMDRAVHDFVVFCKKVPMHVIMVMHPRKTDGGRIDSEFDIKGSSTAVQEASNVILFNRLGDIAHAPERVSPSLCRELKFAKVRRNGRVVGTRIILQLLDDSEAYREAKTV